MPAVGWLGRFTGGGKAGTPLATQAARFKAVRCDLDTQLAATVGAVTRRFKLRAGTRKPVTLVAGGSFSAVRTKPLGF